jgi:hypothetical protein
LFFDNSIHGKEAEQEGEEKTKVSRVVEKRGEKRG